MIITKFKVTNEGLIVRLDNTPIVADSRNIVFAEFEFGEKWTGVKTATFKKGQATENRTLVNNKCDIPNNLLEGSGEIQISVFAGDLRTANISTIGLIPSGYFVADPPEPTEPTETYVKTFSDNTGVQIIRVVEGILEFYDGENWKPVFLPTFEINEEMELIMEVNHE